MITNEKLKHLLNLPKPYEDLRAGLGWAAAVSEWAVHPGGLNGWLFQPFMMIALDVRCSRPRRISNMFDFEFTLINHSLKM